MEDQRPISFQGVTASGSTEEQTHEFTTDGVLTDAKIVTHRGQEYALQNYAEIIRSGTATSLWENLDRDFLAGDGQVYDLDIRFEFERGDVLRLKAENTNTSGNDYHHNVTVGVDYDTVLSDRISQAIGRVL